MISARQPSAFDLPELSRLLSREKTAELLAESRDLANRRRQGTLLSWLQERDLPGRAQRLERLDHEAAELLSQRLGVPLVETTVPAILDNPAYRMVMTDDVFARRVARWPIVNLLHSLLSPLRILIRENAAAGSFFGGAEALVDAHIKIAAGSLTSLVQSAFGQLYQTDPAVAGLYAHRKLWEPREAEMAETRLRLEWIETIQQQRQVVLSRLSGKSGIIAPLIRGLLTIGALLWFPFIQPVLQMILASHSAFGTVRDAAILAVQVISAESLLRNAMFLIIWYLLIWSLLRWGTRRRVDKLLMRWRSAEYADESLNLTTRTLAWIDDLLEPIQAARQTTGDLARRVEELRSAVGEQSKNAA